MTLVEMKVSGSRPAELDRRAQWSVAANRWAETIGPPVRDALKAKAPVGTGPQRGLLRDRIRFQRSEAAGVVRAEFIAYVPYAKFVIEGTRPHEIVPRSARVLHFRTASGEDVFAHRVRHPGTRPNKFVVQTMSVVLPGAREAFKDLMRASIEGV